MDQQKLNFKQIISSKKILSDNVLNKADEEAKNKNVPLQKHLLDSGILEHKQLLFYQAEMFSLPAIDLEKCNKDSFPVDSLPEKIIKEHSILPISSVENSLTIAIADPLDTTALDTVRFYSGLTPTIVLADATAIRQLINQIFEDAEILFDSELDSVANEVETIDVKDDLENPYLEDINNDKDDTPVVKYVHSILLSAIRAGVSDIHFEPYEKIYRVRQRLDGILEEISRPPLNMASKIASRIKIMAGMDISERMKPQDGRIRLRISKNQSMDFRVNSLPTLFGEKIVIRVLDSSSTTLSVNSLGMTQQQKDFLLKSIAQPQGMILVTGPTGSGKTVTLYTGLNILNNVNRNISTVEDPVEINLEGVNQVNVNNKQGLDFAQSLRAFLRQDPDVIMVGEIRDSETANIAIKAAQTGHMVLSTLHTNSVSETLARLVNMGIAPFNIATSVNLIIAQRLARKLCLHCKVVQSIPEVGLLEQGFSKEQIQNAKIYKAQGCKKCNKGYKGRIGIYEVVKITPKIQEIIMKQGDSIEIEKQARKENFLSIREHSLQVVLDGISSLEEINRVTSTK